MSNEELVSKVSFVSERKKFISVREGHGEWLDGELLRGLTDGVFLGIRQIRQNHIEGLRGLGEVFKDFGRKLGFKGLGLIVIGNSLLLNVNSYKTRISYLDARRKMETGNTDEDDFNWKAVSLCEQRGGMDLQEVMQRVIWVTRDQKNLNYDGEKQP